MTTKNQGRFVTIRQADTTTKLAFSHGHYWETVWDHGENSDLRAQRKEPNVLLPGDELFIPPIQMGHEDAATGQRHRYRRRGIPEKLRMRFLDIDGEPHANAPYEVNIGSKTHTGQLDGDGSFEVPIPPDASSAEILIGEEGNLVTTTVRIGGLDPATETIGVQQRLRNLGYYGDSIDGKDRTEYSMAIFRFREDHSMDTDGGDDEAFRDKLLEVHGY